MFFVIFQSCTPIAVNKYSHHPPYTSQEITEILLNLKTQEDAVHSFFSSGTITFQGNGSEFEASSLIVGTRRPFKVKLEITHFWGRPLFHIIVDENKMHILSFHEKLYYVGNIGESTTTNLLPIHLDTNQLWAIGRGFLLLCDFTHAESNLGNRISLLNEQGNVVQQLVFYPETGFPHKTVLSERSLEISFSDFERHNNIPYAGKTRLFDQKNETMLELKIKQMVFNKTIDKSIFDLEIPSDFKTHQQSPLLDTH